MDTKKIETVLTTVTIDSKVDSGKIDVVVGESAKMDVVKAVNYIQSGKAEIEKAVNQGKTVISDHTTEKIGEFDQNAQDKTGDFNTNAINKTTDFNDNYTAKKDVIDGLVDDASDFADLSKQWAIGEPSEPTGGSSKYWAGQASSSLSGLTSRVSAIEGKIPADASSSNQLADKSYVNTADNGLQSQIDALVVASDVFDVVGTYAELQAYDITTVPVNDIIKVLVDETHSGAATYYRCVEAGGVKSWSYIGSEGAYYTKSEADNKFVPQTRTVNSKALSSDITLTASDVGALQSGDNVSELVNDAGYTTNIGTVTSVNGNSPDASGAVTVSGLTIDQTYNPSSTNAQSGTAVAGAISNMVTTDTAQTIGGKKTVENNIFEQIISGTGGYSIQGRTAKGDTPTARDFAQFKYQDNSGDGGTAHRYGCVDFDVNLDKTTTARLRAYQNVAGSTNFAQINVSIAPDGTITTYAPACDDTNSIVTTTGINKGTNSYVKLGNGIIIQGGYAQNIAAGGTITLPTPFTSAGYSVVISMRYNGATGVTACGVYGETTTKFQVSKAASGNAYYRWIAFGN